MDQLNFPLKRLLHVFLAYLILVCAAPAFSFAQSVIDQNAAGLATSGVSSTAKLSNPDLSLIGLFSFSQFDNDNPLSFSGGHDPKQNGFNTQQIELTFGSVIDPYFRGDASLVLVPENGETKIEIEEAYATTLALPSNFQLKAGQFFNSFGRGNAIHPHAWNYVNKPLVLSRMFGGDGLRNPGLQLSWLTSLPWYSEVIFSSQNSNGETAVSFRPDGKMRTLDDSVALLKWNNFFSLSETLSLNVGSSFLRGSNDASSSKNGTQILGGDIYFKYRNPGSLSYFALQAEIIRRDYKTASGTIDDWGWYTELNYRLGDAWQRWMMGLRYDWVSGKQAGAPNTSPGELDPITNETPDRDVSKRFRVSPVLTFYSSEFSKVRLQYDYDKPDSWGNPQHAVHLQLEFLMGAHGAHKF